MHARMNAQNSWQLAQRRPCLAARARARPAHMGHVHGFRATLGDGSGNVHCDSWTHPLSSAGCPCRAQVRTIPRVLRTEWWELYRGNAGFFLPLTGLIYAYVPRDERVLAFGAGSLVYTWILSLWNSARAEARDAAGQQPLGGVDAGGVGAGGVGVEMGGGDAGSGVELCSLTEDDCVVMPNAPPRARALLSVGVRRVLVRARRTTSRRTQPPAMVLAGHHNECGEGGSKGGREGVGEGGSEGEADTVRDLPRLEEWAALDDGRYTGSVDGRTLWIRAAAVDDADDRDRSSGRLRTLNGEVFLLGTRANRELGRRAASSWATAGTAGTIAGAERETVHVAPTGDVWPALAVLAILSLSNAYGVVPGTCIGPAPTNVPSGGVLGVVASQAAARSTVQGRAPPQLQLRGTDAAADAAVRTAVVDAVFGTSYDGSM